MKPYHSLSSTGLLIILVAPGAILAADHPIRGDSLRMHAVRGQRGAMFHQNNALI